MINKIITKIKQNKEEFFWVALGQALAFIGSILGVKLLTNVMTPSEYGDVALGMTIVGFINSVLFGPLGNVIIRYYSIMKDNHKDQLYFLLLKNIHLKLIIFLVISFVPILFILHYFLKSWTLITFCSFLFAIILGINSNATSFFSAIRDRKFVALSQGAVTVLKTMIAVAFVIFIGREGFWAINGYTVGTIFILFWQYKVFIGWREKSSISSPKTPTPSFSQDDYKIYLKKFLKYGSPFIIYSILSSISLYGDRWFIQYLFDKDSIGIYFAIFQIAHAPFLIFLGVVTQFVTPIIFERAGAMDSANKISSSDRLLNLTILFSTAIMVIILAAYYFFSHEIVVLFTSLAYGQHHGLLYIISLGFAFFYVAQIVFLRAQIKQKPGVILPAWIIRGISFIALCFVFAKHFGLNGIAWAYCGSSFLFLLFVVISVYDLKNKIAPK